MVQQQRYSMRSAENISVIDYASSEAGSVRSMVDVVKNDDEESIAKRETKAVLRFRMLFFGILIVSMIIVANLVFLYIKNSETDQFEKQFGEDANKVLQSLGTSIDMTLAGVDAFVVSLVSYAEATNQIWPYVTIPDFAVRAEKVRSLTNAVYLNLYNYVPLDQRYKWEAYSALYGPVWVEESLEMQEKEGMYEDIFVEWNITEVTYWDVIHDYDEWDKDKPGFVGLDPSDPGPFLPMWQTSPLLPIDPPYNWDLFSAPGNESLMAVLDTHKVSMTEAYLIAFENDTETIEENEAEADWISGYITTGEEPMEPISDIYYPILTHAVDYINLHGEEGPNYDNNTSSSSERQQQQQQQELGGFLSMSIYWRDFLKGILPEGTNGIVVVFENPCNPTFTYQINGPAVKYLGTGDFHESKYDHLEKSSPLLELDQYSIRGSSYTGIPINEDFCPFHVRVFPSSLMEEDYITSNRVIFTIISVMIFVSTALSFLTYDWWVQRRQKLVMQTAKRSTAIISDLFPSSVRARLYPTEESNDTTNRSHSNSKAKAFLNTPDKQTKIFQEEDEEDEDNIGPPKTDQIADHFPEVTILFGDLAGFTSWSESREPSQVFTLLETLYGAFDRIAKRRGIFKIETIGDCYVAVTGLPQPRRNHAAAMVVFAAECRKAMNSLTKRLELQLGPGTADLLLRIGINSGPVTAGVLRGEKSRFQLFGDTVNTTARMESNGIPNRIHVSESTAECLRNSGKEDWLTPREELVEAKGKGKMQTYWVEPSKARSIAASDFTTSEFPIIDRTANLSFDAVEEDCVDENPVDGVV